MTGHVLLSRVSKANEKWWKTASSNLSRIRDEDWQSTKMFFINSHKYVCFHAIKKNPQKQGTRIMIKTSKWELLTTHFLYFYTFIHIFLVTSQNMFYLKLRIKIYSNFRQIQRLINIITKKLWLIFTCYK